MPVRSTQAPSTSPAATARLCLPANYTFTAADAGVHTFSATLKTAGSQSLIATDTATGSITGTQTITVQPAAASSLRVAGFPSPIQAGVAGNFTVTALDAFGNTATGYRGTIHFTSSDGQAVLPANYTFTAGDGGVHTFSATLKTAGSQSLIATDTVTGSITGTQTITVQPAAASQPARGRVPLADPSGRGGELYRYRPGCLWQHRDWIYRHDPLHAAATARLSCPPTTLSPPATAACTPSALRSRPPAANR